MRVPGFQHGYALAEGCNYAHIGEFALRLEFTKCGHERLELRLAGFPLGVEALVYLLEALIQLLLQALDQKLQFAYIQCD